MTKVHHVAKAAIRRVPGIGLELRYALDGELRSSQVHCEAAALAANAAPPYAEGRDPFTGESKRVNTARYLAGGTPFGDPTNPDTPISRNLTPDASTGLPAGLTWEQFRQVLRTGADLKHLPPFAPSQEHDLLQVMPWPIYQDMIDRDLRAIYEYLRAIPSLPSSP